MLEADERGVRAAVPVVLDEVRVDRAVSVLTGRSRTEARTLVEAGHVRVDGCTVTRRGSLVHAGQVLEIRSDGDSRPALAPEPEVEVPVVYADEDLVVVDKPAGLVVHPGPGHPERTLAGGLLARYPELAAVGGAGAQARPGIVHRLDRGTSGLMVVARTESAYGSLVHQLSERSVERRYLALVEGRLAEDRGVVDAPLARSTRTPTLMAVAAAGRAARTRYEVRARLALPWPASFVELVLESGRTHQIRVHLSAIGHPVVGDERYGARRRFDAAHSGGRQGSGSSSRVFLHAHSLALEHPTDGMRRHWSSPLPAELACPLGSGDAPWW